MRASRVALAMLAAGVAWVVPTAAPAADVVGSTISQPPDGQQSCPVGPNCVYGQTALPGLRTTPSTSGVITSWTVRPGATGGSYRLRVITPVGGQAAFIRSSGFVPAAPFTNTPVLDQHIPIADADNIGIEVSGGGSVALRAFAGASLNAFIPAPADGTTPSPTSTVPGQELYVQAIVERDRDGDLNGDETQDQCDIDPARATPCVADLGLTSTRSASRILVGQNVTFRFAIRNFGPSPAANALIRNTVLPAGGTAVAITPSSGACFPGSQGGFTCRVGTLGVGESQSVSVTYVATQAGTITDSAGTDSSAADPVSGNNASRETVEVDAVPDTSPPGIEILSTRVNAKSGRAKVKLRCAAGDPCLNGRLRLDTARKYLLEKKRRGRKGRRKTVALGSAGFSLGPEQVGDVTVRLSRAARRLLQQRKRLPVKAAVSAADAAGNSAGAQRRIRVKLAKRKKRRRR